MRALGGIVAPMMLWLVMGALTAAGALCYAELSTRFPQAGGTYVFLRHGFGRRTAFAYGWMAMLVMDPGLTAALAIGTAKYLLAAAGAASRFEVPVAIAVIVVLAAVALRGLASGAVLLRWSAMIKLGMVALLVVAGIAKAVGGATPMPAVATSAVSMPALAGAVVAAGHLQIGRGHRGGSTTGPDGAEHEEQTDQAMEYTHIHSFEIGINAPPSRAARALP